VTELQDIRIKNAAMTTAADVVSKAQAVLSDSELLRAMFEVGYFPPNTPPPGWMSAGQVRAGRANQSLWSFLNAAF